MKIILTPAELTEKRLKQEFVFGVIGIIIQIIIIFLMVKNLSK